MIKNAQSMLGVLLHAPRGPFYSPKADRSRWEQSRKAILAFYRLAHRSVRCTTGHCPVRISFLFWRSRPLKTWSRWRTGHCPVHTGQSGAPIRPLARPHVTRGLRGRPLAQPTVGSPDSPVSHRTVQWIIVVRCWLGSREQRLRRRRLTGHCPVHHRTLSGAPPDSPVIYSRTPPSRPESSQLTRRQPGTPDTVRCTTGQSGAPRLSRVLAAWAKSFPIVFSLILALRQIC
jgi:hypothetical protein